MYISFLQHNLTISSTFLISEIYPLEFYLEYYLHFNADPDIDTSPK